MFYCGAQELHPRGALEERRRNDARTSGSSRYCYHNTFVGIIQPCVDITPPLLALLVVVDINGALIGFIGAAQNARLPSGHAHHQRRRRVHRGAQAPTGRGED